MKEIIEILLKGKKLLFLQVSDCESVIAELQKQGYRCRIIPVPMIVSSGSKLISGKGEDVGWLTANVYVLELISDEEGGDK